MWFTIKFKIKFHFLLEKKKRIKQFIIQNKIKRKNKEARYLTFDAINTSLAMLKHSNTISKPLIPTKCHKFPLSLTRGKKGNRRSNPSHAIATFHPRSNRTPFVPETVFPFSIYIYTQKKRRCEKKKESVIKFPKRPMTTTPNPI